MQKVPDAFCILLYGAPVKFLIGFGYPTVYVKVVVCDKDPVTVAIMTVQFITRADHTTSSLLTLGVDFNT